MTEPSNTVEVANRSPRETMRFVGRGVWRLSKVAFALSLFYGAFVQSPLSVIDWLEKNLSKSTHSPAEQALTGLSCVVLSISLFQFRTYWKMYYGMTEVGVALLTFHYAITSTPTPLTPKGAAFGIVTGVYVFVRGLDNWRVGATEELCIDANVARMRTRILRTPEGVSKAELLAVGVGQPEHRALAIHEMFSHFAIELAPSSAGADLALARRAFVFRRALRMSNDAVFRLRSQKRLERL